MHLDGLVPFEQRVARGVVVRLRMWSRLVVLLRQRCGVVLFVERPPLERLGDVRVDRRLAVLRRELGQVEDLHDGDDCAGVEDGGTHGFALLLVQPRFGTAVCSVSALLLAALVGSDECLIAIAAYVLVLAARGLAKI